MQLCSYGCSILLIEVMQTYLCLRLCNLVFHGFQSVSAYMLGNLCLWLQCVSVKLLVCCIRGAFWFEMCVLLF
jgi:hypothetical protein